MGNSCAPSPPCVPVSLPTSPSLAVLFASALPVAYSETRQGLPLRGCAQPCGR